MSRFKTLALATATSAALLVSAPAFAQTTGTPTTAAHQHSADLNCGRLTELRPDHALIRKDDGSTIHILLGVRTRYIGRTQVAAIAGLHEGDFAAAAAGDGQGDGAAHALLFGIRDFCYHEIVHRVRVNGTITDYSNDVLTVRAAGHDPYAFALLERTKFYVNGQQVPDQPSFQNGEPVRVTGFEEKDGSYAVLVVAVKTSS